MDARTPIDAELRKKSRSSDSEGRVGRRTRSLAFMRRPHDDQLLNVRVNVRRRARVRRQRGWRKVRPRILNASMSVDVVQITCCARGLNDVFIGSTPSVDAEQPVEQVIRGHQLDVCQATALTR